MLIRTNAPAARLEADTARRTISGMVAPWGTYAHVSTGQNVAFARGSLVLSERAKLVLDHDPGRPVAVYSSATDTEHGLMATFRVPAGAQGDAVLAEAGDGLRDGLSVSAELDTFAENKDGSIWVTAAKGRHVALLSEPAFDAARVTDVTAQAPAPRKENPVTDLAVSAAAIPAPPQPAETAPPDPVTLTAAGLASMSPQAPPPAPARVTDPYPYAQPLELGGPSFVRDALAAMENSDPAGAERWYRAQAMGRDPVIVRAGLARMSRRIDAAPGTTTADPALVPPRWLPDRYVPLLGAKAPLYTALAKWGTPDFNTLELPRTLTETGLSGVPADEITPIAPGTITTGNDTVTISEVEGAYTFSRKLLMGSNPQIDRIALDAMERAWLAQIETEAVAYFQGGATVHTAVTAAYTDGPTYIAALQAQFAAMAAGTLYSPTVVIPATKEYVAASTAHDTTGRALLPYGPSMNSSGETSSGYSSAAVQGVPLMPGPYMPAKNTLILDQSRPSAVAFVTPVQDFRLEWTTDATTGGNVKLLKLVKYSGVGFWSQYIGGVVLLGPSGTGLPFAEGDPPEDGGSTRGAKK